MKGVMPCMAWLHGHAALFIDISLEKFECLLGLGKVDQSPEPRPPIFASKHPY